MCFLEGCLGHEQPRLGLGDIGHGSGPSLFTLFQGGEDFPVRPGVLFSQGQQLPLPVYLQGGDDGVQGQGLGVVKNAMVQRGKTSFVQADLAGSLAAIVETLGQIGPQLGATFPMVVPARIAGHIAAEGIRSRASAGIQFRIPAAPGLFQVMSYGFPVTFDHFQTWSVPQGVNDSLLDHGQFFGQDGATEGHEGQCQGKAECFESHAVPRADDERGCSQ